jgi:hypothetical protein
VTTFKVVSVRATFKVVSVRATLSGAVDDPYPVGAEVALAVAALVADDAGCH